MSAILSKSSLARVASKVTIVSSCKKPKFSHNCSVEKDQLGSITPSVVIPPSFVNLEEALETAPMFDECVNDLPIKHQGGLLRGRKRLTLLSWVMKKRWLPSSAWSFFTMT